MRPERRQTSLAAAYSQQGKKHLAPARCTSAPVKAILFSCIGFVARSHAFICIFLVVFGFSLFQAQL